MFNITRINQEQVNNLTEKQQNVLDYPLTPPPIVIDNKKRSS
jgi:hypothetical protein